MAEQEQIETAALKEAETIILKDGETVYMGEVIGATYALEQPIEQMTFIVDGSDFIVGVDTTGDGTADAHIVFLDLASMAGHPAASTLQIAGVEYDVAVLIDLLDGALETEGGLLPSGGASEYSDDFGTSLTEEQAGADTLGDTVFGSVFTGIPQLVAAGSLSRGDAESGSGSDGSGSGGGGTGVAVTTAAGQVVDGYIVGATVFRDANNNGTLDAGEVSGTTDINGNFSLTGGSGPLISIGGTDVSTGLAFDGVLKAPEGATVITPLTTLVQQLVEAGGGETAATAEAKVKAAFDIPESFDLSKTDPVKAAVDGTAGGLEAAKAGIAVANTAKQVKAFLADKGATDDDALSNAVFKAVAMKVVEVNNPGENSITKLGNPAKVVEIIDDATPGSGATVTFEDKNTASDVIGTGNTAVKNVTDVGAAGLTKLAKIAKVAQTEAIEAVKDGNTGDYTDDSAYDAAVEDAEVGDVDGFSGDSAAAAIAATWVDLDRQYVEAGADAFLDPDISLAFVELGNDYVAYLNDGGEALLDLVKAPSGRLQSLHDNLLGNIGDGPINSRFTNHPDGFREDPRSDDAMNFGGRPYHSGSLTDGEYDAAAALAVINWDLDHGVKYPVDLPDLYKPFTDGTLLFGATLGVHVRAVAEDHPTDAPDGFHPGNGNSDVNFVIHDNTEAEVEAAIKAKARFQGDLDSEGDTYFAALGYSDRNANGDPVDNSEIGFWNFEYSVINYGENPDLSDYDISITADFTDYAGNITAGILDFDPIAHRASKGGTEDYYQDDSGETVGVQNSQNMSWQASGDYNATVPGTYTVTLTVTDESGSVVAQTEMKVVVEADITVGAGKMYETIQAAIDEADDGAVIFVEPGTYAGNLVIDKPVKLYGAFGGINGDSTLRSVGEETVIEGGITINGDADNTVIDGFRIENQAEMVADGERRIGVHLEKGATGVIVGNNIFEANDTAADNFNLNTRGMTMQGDNDGLIVQGNSFTGWRSAVYLEDNAAEAQVKGNTFEGNLAGVVVDNTKAAITDNTFLGSDGIGLGAQNPASDGVVTLNGNTFEEGRVGVFVDGWTVKADDAGDGTTLVLQPGIQSITLQGSADLAVIGNDGVNQIVGNDGNNRLEGAGGFDTLTGGEGNDTFIVGVGDILTDFVSGEDVIDLDALLDSLGVATDARATSVTVGPAATDGNVTISVDGNPAVLLTGISLDDLTAEDFELGTLA